VCLARCPCAGLDIEKDTIIEIACLVTDGELRQIVEVRCSQPQQCAVRALHRLLE
jgi:oligoribonuclease (3'-5' exoribonuclease)